MSEPPIFDIAAAYVEISRLNDKVNEPVAVVNAFAGVLIRRGVSLEEIKASILRHVAINDQKLAKMFDEERSRYG